MNVNEAIRIMRARAPVVTCGAATIWHIGHIRFSRIESITHKVDDKGKLSISAFCVVDSTPGGVHMGLDDIELADDCPEILRKMIYKDGSAPSPSEKIPQEEEALPKETKEKAPPEPVFISIILNDKSYYDIPISKVEKWKEIYPAVDVEQELREMSDWAESNPSKRKTKKGILTFIRNWLSKEQDKGGSQSKRYVKNDDAERSFDIDEFDRFTLGIG